MPLTCPCCLSGCVGPEKTQVTQWPPGSWHTAWQPSVQSYRSSQSTGPQQCYWEHTPKPVYGTRTDTMTTGIGYKALHSWNNRLKVWERVPSIFDVPIALSRQMVHNRGRSDSLSSAGGPLDQTKRSLQHRLHSIHLNMQVIISLTLAPKNKYNQTNWPKQKTHFDHWNKKVFSLFNKKKKDELPCCNDVQQIMSFSHLDCVLFKSFLGGKKNKTATV